MEGVVVQEPKNPRCVTKLELGDCCASGLVCWNEPVDILIFFRLTFDNTLLDEEWSIPSGVRTIEKKENFHFFGVGGAGWARGTEPLFFGTNSPIEECGVETNEVANMQG